MQKGIKITLIILSFLIGIVLLDTLQAKIFNNSPLLKIRQYYDEEKNYYIDKGLFVNHYYCSEKEEKTLFKKVKYSCPLQDSQEIADGIDKELVECIENELGAYLVTENDSLKEIPLSEIKKSDTLKIAYYKGVQASNNQDNMYVLVYPKNGTYEFSVMKDFDKYFYEKFAIYQTYESPLTPTIYIHSQNNDVDFKNILNKCHKVSNSNEESLPTKTVNNLKETTKIIIKNSDKTLGTIKDNKQIQEILTIISSSKRSGSACLADNYSFEFEMYDNNNKLIDTIYVWHDGYRLLPKSINGCYYSHYSDTDLRKIIEKTTDFVFYDILDLRDSFDQKLQLIFKNNKYNYYLKSDDTNEILIKFSLTNQVMTLKYALKNKYITAAKVATEYPEILIEKSN